jgi:hypothetical protein
MLSLFSASAFFLFAYIRQLAITSPSDPPSIWPSALFNSFDIPDVGHGKILPIVFIILSSKDKMEEGRRQKKKNERRKPNKQTRKMLSATNHSTKTSQIGDRKLFLIYCLFGFLLFLILFFYFPHIWESFDMMRVKVNIRVV